MDTVDVFLRGLDPGELEKFKRILVSNLVRKRVLDKFRFRGHFLVAIDGTGLYSYSYEPFAGCPSKTSKNGQTTWQVYALEAKLVCQAGFSILLATKWLCNSENISEKQDCELKAFYRLAGWLTETSMYVKDVCYREKYTMNWIEYTSFYSSCPG